MIREGETNVEEFGREEKFIQGFGRETSLKETTWKTQA